MEWSWYILLLIPIAWLVQNVLHELSHLIAAYISFNASPKIFKPYPHMYNGRFYFARTEFKYDYKDFRDAIIDPSTVDIAPFISGIFWAGLLTLLSLGFNTLCLLSFIACNIIDSLFFWYTYIWGSFKSDGKKWRNR